MDDQQIVELYWQRSEAALSETAAKYSGYCHAIAYGILHDREDAEECVNDTYMEAWNSIPPHRPGVLSTFLGKLTRRLSIDRLRHKTAQKRGGGEVPLVLEELGECIANDDDPVGAYEKKRLGEIIRAFVGNLPETQRRIFICRYWHMEPIGTIAARLGWSESRVKSMLARTREKLRRILVKEGFQ